MKTLVIYKSKTGFTKRYAQWIHEAISCDLLNYNDISTTSLSTYDLIIYGSRIHAGKMDGFHKIKTLLSEHKKIRLLIFPTGGTPIEAEETINSIWKASLTEDELHTIPHFYFPAGLNYESMGIGDKLIMKALAKMLSSKKIKMQQKQVVNKPSPIPTIFPLENILTHY